MFILPVVALCAALPAAAQDDVQPGDEKINQLIIYGDDKCPQSTGDEITVCARLPEDDRYRIPKSLRDDPNDPRKESWTNRAIAYEHVAASGTLSCSPVGSGGFTGCGFRNIDQAYAEKRTEPSVAFGRLIAAERRKRLAGIDAESELVEDAVIAEERAAAAKKLQQQASGVSTEGSIAADAEELPVPN